MHTTFPTSRRWPMPALLMALALPPAALLAHPLLGRVLHAGVADGLALLAPLPGWVALVFAMRWHWSIRAALAAAYLPVLGLASLLDGG